MVRNEADIIALCIDHHFSNARLDQIIIMDDASDDGTFEILQNMRNDRLHVARREGKFEQAATLSALATQAYDMGAKWIVPFDADEFWFAAGGLGKALRKVDRYATVQVDVTNYVQHRSIDRPSVGSLTNVRYRPVRIGEQCSGPTLVETGGCSFAEMVYPPKFVHRAAPDLQIGEGNHVPAPGLVARETSIQCLHVPLRARNILEAKVAQARRLDEAGYPPDHGWHVRRFAKVAADDGLDAEWAANSEREGCLDTARGRVPLVYDPLVANLVKKLPGRAPVTGLEPTRHAGRLTLGAWRRLFANRFG